MVAVEFPFGWSDKLGKPGTVAVIKGWKWASEDKTFEEALNAMMDPDGPSGSIPQPELWAANQAIKKFGGKIIKEDLPEYPPKGMIL